MSSFVRRSLLLLVFAGVALAAALPAGAQPAVSLYTPGELNALVVRSEALNQLHQDAAVVMAPSELRALQLRSEALNQLFAPASTVVSPQELRAGNIRGQELNRLYASPSGGSTGSGFDWWYGVAGGLGTFGLALAVGGLAVVRRRGVRPATA